MGANLRSVLLSVPPALPALHQALSLSYGAAGFLTSLPVLIMALGAIPGAFLTARVGARRAVSAGLLTIAIGTAMRGGLPSVVNLFVFTVVLALGIAVTQPALPSLVQAWFPRHVARATAIYSNGLLIGEVLAATLTLPLLFGALHLGWQQALAVWAIPVVVVLVAWLLWTTDAGAIRSAAGAKWRPDWRSGRTWHIGFLLGGAAIAYFGMNTWIPDTLTARHGASLIAITLGSLNLAQLPVSAWVAVAGDRILGRRWPYVVAGLGIAGGVLGYAVAPLATAPLWAGLIGAASSLIFILNLGLPALMAADQVARVSGFMLTIGYMCAFLAPSIGGLAWDRTGSPIAALLPIILAGLGVVVLGATLPRFSLARTPSPEGSPPAW